MIGPARILFLFIIGVSLATGQQQDAWTGVERIVAVGDVHGDYKQFMAVLQSAGVIDKKQKWIGGKTHLVQTGDVLDRGADSRKVMDLLMQLEKQASKAGGYVHALTGNHEAMNIYGDLRYVSPGEYEAFRSERSKEINEHFFKQKEEEAAKSGKKLDRKQWDAEHPPGFFEHRTAFGPKEKYGKWIRGHNAVVQINDTIFLHGGIGPKHAADSVRAINERIRAELDDFTKLQGGIAVDPEGPLWYRGLAQGDEAALAPHVDAVLKHYSVSRIVIGHTPTSGAVLPRFGGRVVLIDVGLSAHYGSRMACLAIEKEQAYAVHRGKKLPLPTGGGAPVADYLKQVAAMEPTPMKTAAGEP